MTPTASAELTEYQALLLDLLGLRKSWENADSPKNRRKGIVAKKRADVWDRARRQVWATPCTFVRGIEIISGIQVTVDVCAEAHTAKAPKYFGPGSPYLVDALREETNGLGEVYYNYWGNYLKKRDVLWCNPDFLRKWVWAAGIQGGTHPGFLLVPPATDQSWFGDLLEDKRSHLTVLEGRMCFEPPEGVEPSTPNGGTVLWSVNFDEPVLPCRLDWKEVCEIGAGRKMWGGS